MTDQVPASPESVPSFDPYVYELGLGPEDRAVVDSLRYEVANCSPQKREEQEVLIHQLLAEMAMSERVQAQIDADIATVKHWDYTRLTGNASELGSKAETIIDPAKIGWIQGKEGYMKLGVERQEYAGTAYWLGSLVEENKVTNDAFEHLIKEGVAEPLIATLKEHVIPGFLDRLKSGKGGSLRPVSRSARKGHGSRDRSLDTTYPAYKVDVQGTNNRAILLVVGAVNDEPSLALVAMYDHEDQKRVLNALSI